MTMNLCEFFECMDPETVVIVECNGENIFLSKVCDISEDESVAYWIKSKSIVFKDGVMLIPVVVLCQDLVQIKMRGSAS